MRWHQNDIMPVSGGASINILGGGRGGGEAKKSGGKIAQNLPFLIFLYWNCQIWAYFYTCNYMYLGKGRWEGASFFILFFFLERLLRCRLHVGLHAWGVLNFHFAWVWFRGSWMELSASRGVTCIEYTVNYIKSIAEHSMGVPGSAWTIVYARGHKKRWCAQPRSWIQFILSDIFNLTCSLSTGRIPDAWKLSRVPVFKSGDLHTAFN